MRTFLNKARTGKTRVWEIGFVGDQVITRYGEQGGAMQEVSDTAFPLNVGKSNEKSAETVAQETVARQILLKTRQGYVEEGSTEVRVESIDFDALPINLRFYKPEGQISARMVKLLEAKKALMGRKRDGEMFVAVINSSGDPVLYSRTMLPTHAHEPDILWAERFPQIVCDLEDSKLLPGTILLGELVCDRQGKDDFKHVERVLRGKKDYALQLQMDEGWLSYYVWDIAFLGTQDLKSYPFLDRLNLLRELFNIYRSIPLQRKFEHLLPLEFCEHADLPEDLDAEIDVSYPTYDATQGPVRNFLIEKASKKGWEGYVVIDYMGVYGDKMYNFRGKTDRPGKYCCKLKTSETDDFVALWDPENGIGEYGTGKYQGLVGSVQLFQLNSAGELIYISDCGNGYTEEDLAQLSNIHSYPRVLEIRFDERTYKSEGARTNALRFARLERIRSDKLPGECVNAALDES